MCGVPTWFAHFGDSYQLPLWLPLTCSVKPFCLLCSFCYTSILFCVYCFPNYNNYCALQYVSNRVTCVSWNSHKHLSHQSSRLQSHCVALAWRNVEQLIYHSFGGWGGRNYFSLICEFKRNASHCAVQSCTVCTVGTHLWLRAEERINSWWQTEQKSHCFFPLDSKDNFNNNAFKDLCQVVWCTVCHGRHLCIMSISRFFLHFPPLQHSVREQDIDKAARYKIQSGTVAADLHAAFFVFYGKNYSKRKLMMQSQMCVWKNHAEYTRRFISSFVVWLFFCLVFFTVVQLSSTQV